MRLPGPALCFAVLCAALAPAQASATTLLTASTAASKARLVTCHAKLRTTGAAVKVWHSEASKTGLLVARSSGGADWDLAVLGAGGRFVAGAAGPDSSEIASGFVVAGEPLTIQACLVRGGRSSVHVKVDTFAVKLRDHVAKMQLVAVEAPTAADRDRLLALGFDPAESASARTIDIVADEQSDLARLRRAGFTYTVKVDDLVATERRRAKLDLAYARRVRASGMPSGATGYRHLADIEAELKALASKNPGLVKLITLPHKSLEGRDVVGAEITQNVNLKDGKPVFLNVGVHHAREWPSAEHPLEWAYELVKGYGKDARVTRLVDAVRTIVVPVVNPDGFNLSREAPVDPGNALAMVDLPPDVDSQLPITDPTYTAALLADQNAGFFAYKRRNCRIKDGAAPAPGECENSDNRLLGVDPNRNYGMFWGGGGAAVEVDDDTYRGAAPFSEPEPQNIRELVSSRQVSVLITNHTFSGLVLRPPGIKAEGSTPDEALYKALGDGMAADNGYTSEYGYQLYDTTGTTEDWSYFATGGFGFTFEIGPDEFHPPYEEVVAEYEGAGAHAGKGNREAYLLATEWAADRSKHAVISGAAPAGNVLRLHKEFESETSAVIKDAHGLTGPPQYFHDVLDTTMTVPDSGHFEWDINQSTRPFVMKTRRFTDVNAAPASSQDISSPTPELPSLPRDVEFEVKPDAARQIRASVEGSSPDDYDIYLYQGSVAPENQIASSASSDANEVIVYNNPTPGKYVLEIQNYSAAQPYNGKIEVFGELPGSEVVEPAHDEAWDLTCETASGQVLAKSKVQIARGEAKDLGNPCTLPAAAPKALKLRLRVKKVKPRVLRLVATCSRKCTLTVFAKAGRRVVGRARTVKFRGKHTIKLRVKGGGRRLVVSAVAKDKAGTVRAKKVRVKR